MRKGSTDHLGGFSQTLTFFRLTLSGGHSPTDADGNARRTVKRQSAKGPASPGEYKSGAKVGHALVGRSTRVTH